MTKNKHENKTKLKNAASESEANPKENEKIMKIDSIDEEDQGFGGWLRSPDGLENMKFFVIANSIVLLTTLAYPNIQLFLEIIYETFYGPDSTYD